MLLSDLNEALREYICSDIKTKTEETSTLIWLVDSSVSFLELTKSKLVMNAVTPPPIVTSKAAPISVDFNLRNPPIEINARICKETIIPNDPNHGF